MKRELKFQLVLFSAVLLAAANIYGTGSDHSTNAIVEPSWPKGMAELVNTTNRVHGYWVTASDVFFFQGGTNEFNAFLQAYSKIDGIDDHQLILHEGIGDAKSPWEKTPRACDWELFGIPKRWLEVSKVVPQGTNTLAALQAAAATTNYVLRVEFWTGGKIAFDQIKVPENVKVVRDAKNK
jgi:hypothetical protein